MCVMQWFIRWLLAQSLVVNAGLDSTTAMHLVATLRQLAQGGRAILTTIHQPSSRLYQMLDKLLLLSEGYVALLLLAPLGPIQRLFPPASRYCCDRMQSSAVL